MPTQPGPGAQPVSPASDPADSADGGSGPVDGLIVRVGSSEYRFAPAKRLVLGRDPECDIVIDNEHVSRQHLELSRPGRMWQAANLSQSTGTSFNGHEMISQPISEITRLEIGGHTGVIVELEPISPPAARVSLFSDIKELPQAELVGSTAGPSVVERPAGTNTVRIGRDPANDLTIDDLQVSRFHAEVEFQDGADPVIRDLGSSNGTYINGFRTRQALLQDNTVVTLGHTSLVLRNGQLIQYRDEGLLDFDVDGLEVRGHHDRLLLRNLSISVPPRTLLGVLGPSGAGKSTFIKAVVGAVPTTKGEVLYGGVNLLKSLDAARQSIGYVPQDDILHGALTVQKSLTYAARLRLSSDVTDAEVQQLVDKVLRQLGLNGHEMKRIEQLSGGQRKRVSTAMELLTEPPLLVLDEPSSGLDPGNEKSLMELLQSLAKQETSEDNKPVGRRVLVVTHSVQSLALCDLILVLAPGPENDPGGRLAFYGPPEHLLEYFGVEDSAEVFRALEQDADRDWNAQFEQSPFHEPVIHTDSATADSSDRPVRSPLGWMQQLVLLTRRYVRVMMADTTNLAILAAQAPAIGIMLALVGAGGFKLGEGGAPSSKLIILLLGLVLAITYVGASNSIREVVKERPIFLRERALGLRPSAYLASKLVVLVAITAVQAFLLTLFGTLSAGGVAAADSLGVFGGQPRLGLLMFMIISGVAAVALGLMISSLVTNSDKAMSLLPVILLGMYLLSGGPTNIDDIPVLGQLSYLNSVRFGLSGSAMLTDAPQLLVCPPTDGLAAADAALTAERCRSSWEPSKLGLLLNALAPLVLGSAMTGAAVYRLGQRQY